MATALSLLHHLTAVALGLFIALGSFIAPHAVAVNPPIATTTPQHVYTRYADFPAGKSAEVASPLLADPFPKSVGISSHSASSSNLATPTQQTPTANAPTYSTEQLNTLARASLVNILCTTKSGGYFNPISGSGVIIDSRGIILTNAHVGQYFLLRDYPTPGNVQCVVRTGSPAQPRYTAELLYLPQSWIAANAGDIASSTPEGTGEHDFSFLYITGTTDGSALPSSFPALPMDGTDPSTGDTMVLAAYPAGFLGGISIALNLYQTSAVASVGELYSFSSDEHVDLFSLGGTVVSQSGSSGGAVVNSQGKLQGLIVTEVPAATTAGRDLRALSVGHINRTLEDEGLGGITGLLSGDPANIAAQFNQSIAPAETKALEKVLNAQ